MFGASPCAGPQRRWLLLADHTEVEAGQAKGPTREAFQAAAKAEEACLTYRWCYQRSASRMPAARRPPLRTRPCLTRPLRRGCGPTCKRACGQPPQLLAQRRGRLQAACAGASTRSWTLEAWVEGEERPVHLRRLQSSGRPLRPPRRRPPHRAHGGTVEGSPPWCVPCLPPLGPCLRPPRHCHRQGPPTGPLQRLGEGQETFFRASRLRGSPRLRERRCSAGPIWNASRPGPACCSRLGLQRCLASPPLGREKVGSPLTPSQHAPSRRAAV